MKKKLALILSTALVLAALVCLFAFPMSAAEGDYVDANTSAKEMWKAVPAAKISTQVKLGGVAVNEGSGDLSALNAEWTTGSYTFEDGVLTLKGNGNTLSANLTDSNGAIWIVLDNINLAGAINFTGGAFTTSSDTAPDTDLPVIISSPIDANKNLKADGVGGVISHSNGTNAIRSNCSMVIMGDIGLDMGTGSAAAFADRGLNASRNANGKWYKTVIVATGRPSTIGCAAVSAKNTVGFQNDAGTWIFDNTAPLTIHGGILVAQGTLMFTNNADVTVNVKTDAGAKIDCTNFIMNDSAKLTVNGVQTNTTTWRQCIRAVKSFVMDSGVINLNYESPAQTLIGIGVGSSSGATNYDTSLQKNVAVANYNGGTININMKSTYAAGTNAGTRAIGLFGDYMKEVNFNGTKVNMNIDAKMATNQTNTAVMGGSGTMIMTQHSVALNVNDGEFVLNGEKCDGAIGMEHWGVLSLNGGTFTGKALSFINNPTGGLTVNINSDKAYADEFDYVDTFMARRVIHYIKLTNELNGGYQTATTINVTPPATENFFMNYSKLQLKDAEAEEMGMDSDALTFCPYDPIYNTATVTLNGVKEGCKKINANGIITYIVKGENTIKGVAKATNQLNSSNGMTITGDGTLNVLNAGNYSVCTQRYITVEDSVKVNVESTTGNAVHVARSGATASTLTVKDSAVLDITYAGTGVYIPGGAPTVIITDNAEVALHALNDAAAGDAFNLLLDRDDGTGNQTIYMEVSGNAKLTTDPMGNCTRLNYAAYDDSTEEQKKKTAGQILDATVVNMVALFKDNAQVSIAARGQGLYLNAAKASDAGIGNATVTIQDNAVCYFESTDPEDVGTYSSGMQLNADNAQLNILGGKTTIIGKGSGWNRSALYLSYNKGNNNVLIKDAEVSVQNYLTGEGASEYGDIGNAILVQNGGTLTVAGTAKLDAYSEHNGTKWNNRAHAYFMSENSTLTIQDQAVASFTAGGDSKASTAAGIHTKGGKIVVKDKGTLKCGLKGDNGTAALTFELESSLTTEGNAKVYLDGGKNGVGVRNYNKSSAGVIEVKGGVVTITGKTAVSSSNVKPVINSAKMKAGDDAASAKEVDKLTYKEKYVQLTGKNPVTSDVNVAIFAIFALAAVASTAAIMLRKKSRG